MGHPDVVPYEHDLAKQVYELEQPSCEGTSIIQLVTVPGVESGKHIARGSPYSPQWNAALDDWGMGHKHAGLNDFSRTS